MHVAFSYARLFIASWLFMGGVAIQLNPSPAAVARDARWRERKLEAVQADQRATWIEDRNIEDANTRAYLRICGVMLGGAGMAIPFGFMRCRWAKWWR